MVGDGVEQSNSAESGGRSALIVRLATGLIVGVILGLVANSIGEQITLGLHLAMLCAVFTGAVVLAGAGVMRTARLAIWAVVVTAVIAAIGWYDWTTTPNGDVDFLFGSYAGLLVLPAVFIANELAIGAGKANRLIAPFSTYYDQAWKRGVQLALAILFTGLFWAILWIGATLLSAIGFDWLEDLLGEELVALPMLSVAFAMAVHLGDMQVHLLATARTTLLNVLAWLLPVITAVSLVFVASLPVSGLEPLWETGAATAGLLIGCVFFVLLINAAYEDGDDGRKINAVLAWSAQIAGLLLLVFACLGGWGIWLRIEQHGLSPARVIAVVGVLIAVLYGFGYSTAALKPTPWMGLIKPVNIGMAFVMVGLVLAMLTPLAAPAKLSVNDQLNRLARGTVTPNTFDWRLLAEETGTFGHTALEKLKTDKNPVVVRLATEALAGSLSYDDYPQDGRPVVTLEPLLDVERIALIVPADRQLPASLVSEPASDNVPERWQLTCGPKEGDRCFVLFVDLAGDRADELVIGVLNTGRYGRASVLQKSLQGWDLIGTINAAGLGDQLKKSAPSTATPLVRDLLVGDQRYQLIPIEPDQE